jgi:glycosyltransferase involved in cell wall biosynthesis
MRIGFDAKWFYSGNPSGRVVVRNILAHLPYKHPEHDFYIFLKSSEKDLPFPHTAPNIHLVYVWGKMSLISNVLAIPIKALFLKLDVCIFQYSAPPISFFKRIVYLHDVIFEDSPEYFSLWERLYYSPLRMLARQAHRIITVSESEKNRIILHKYGYKKNIDVVCNGVDPKYQPKEFQNKALLEITGFEYKLPEKYLLYVGRLNERKNIKNLLKAIPLLQDRSIKLVLGGSCQWKMFDLPLMIRTLNIEERVLLPGFIQDELLAPLFSLAMLFCYISFDEGFGIPPLEAMASGVPVVVANTGSLPEICAEAGNYVDPHNPADVAKMIDTLLSSKALYDSKRLAGMARAKFFSWERSAEDILNSIVTTVKTKY